MIVATYNVEFLFDEGEHQHSGQTWVYKPEYVAERVSKLAEKFKQINADVLLLQEVGSESVVHKIIEQSGLSYQAFFGETDRFGVGNAVLYRVPVTQVSSVPTTGALPSFGSDTADNLSPHIPSRRGFVHATVEYQGAPLHIIGLHIKANFLTNAAG
jgi:endonuclease/exonuclease/phosphatase family metal-dependent hydrolase